MRQFVVGTGGYGLRPVGTDINSAVQNADTVGVLELSLNSSSYSWDFKKADFVGNGTFSDQGLGQCH